MSQPEPSPDTPQPSDEATIRLPAEPAVPPAGWQQEQTIKLERQRGEPLPVTLREGSATPGATSGRIPMPSGPDTFGPYRLREVIGEGELGVVHRARDVVLGRDCALKVLSRSALAEQPGTEHFLAVARKLAGINHPNLTSIFAIETDDEARLGVAMELISGRSLGQIVADGDVSGKPTDWIDHLIQAVRALDAAGSQGIVHGDLKPSNIMLTDRGLIKISDFGFPHGKPAPDSAEAAYMPPEAWRDEPLDHRGDMFSLAAVFYHLIAGHPPFSGQPSGPPTAISKLTARCPVRLAEILERMLAPDPRDRYRSYRRLLKALEPLLPGTLEPVEIWKRAEAVVLFDMVGFMFLTAFTYLVLLITFPVGRWLAVPLSLLIFFYYYHFLMRRFGQTVGKMVFRAEVHHVTGDPLLPGRLAARFLLTYGPFLFLFEAIHWRLLETRPGAAACALTLAYLLVDGTVGFWRSDRRALHDLLLGTWVVRRGTAQTSGEDDYVEPTTVAECELAAARARGERIGQTVVIDSLGEGGMGQVFRGYDEQLHRQVAVKVLSEKLDTSSDFYERFIREARILANLAHPNLVQVYSFGADEERHYFTMELIQGRSLAQLLSLEGPLEPKTASRYLIQACRGLEAAHQCGVIHRDVKPSNMILSANGTLKMVDFGLAKGAGPGQSTTELTATGIIMGTPHYMSPEQGRGDPVDHRSDIYSLGASMFHLLTGSYPYIASTPMGIVVKHITDPLPIKKLQVRGVPDGLIGIIIKMMHKNPEERFQSYRQVIEAVEQLLPSQFIRAGFWTRSAALLFDVLFGLAGWAAGLATVIAVTQYEVRQTRQQVDSDMWISAFNNAAGQLLPYWMVLGVLPGVVATFLVWKRSATPGMWKVDLRLVRTNGMPTGGIQRFAWFFIAPELYMLLMAIVVVAASSWPGALAALGMILLPGISTFCAVRYSRSLGEIVTRSYMVYG